METKFISRFIADFVGYFPNPHWLSYKNWLRIVQENLRDLVIPQEPIYQILLHYNWMNKSEVKFLGQLDVQEVIVIDKLDEHEVIVIE